ncbi:divalent-cation tolerance protein CutA [Actinomycetota bacterium]
MNRTAPAGMPEVVVVMTTEASVALARSLARKLVERRVAACASFCELGSVYRWNDDIVEDDEVQITIKTSPTSVDGLVAAITELHSYDVPEILVLEAQAAASYAAWVSGVVDQP